MARYHQYYREEPAPVLCPRCGKPCVQRFAVDVEASRARMVPGLLFETHADCIKCTRCHWWIALAGTGRTRNLSEAHKVKHRR